jgi:hypothetical protein
MKIKIVKVKISSNYYSNCYHSVMNDAMSIPIRKVDALQIIQRLV